jgi:gamma-glutamyl hydrolase
MLLPGGGALLVQEANKDRSTEYQKAASYIVQHIKQQNKNGRVFPLIATCLGFENLVISENDDDPKIMRCDFDDSHKNHSIAINEDEFKKSKFWNTFEKKEVDFVFGNSVTYFTHHCGFTPEDFKKHKKLPNEYLMIGTSKNEKGVEFVSSIEHKTLPIIGNQWHPEKNQFERGEVYSFLDRSARSTRFLGDIVRKMVQKVRKESKNLSEIPNFIKPYFSVYRTPEALNMKSYERIYCFERNNFSKE